MDFNPSGAGQRYLRMLALGLICAGCTSSPPSRHLPTDAWLAITNQPATAPPPRLPSPVAPAPQSAFVPQTNAATAPKTFQETLAEFKGTPPTDDKLYSFSARDLEVQDALALFARNNDLNIVPDPEVSGKVTVDFRNLTLEKSMEAVLDTFGYYAEIDRGLIRVRKIKTEFFSVDYVRLIRTGNGNMGAIISSSSGGGGGAGAAMAGPPGAGAAGGAAGDGASVSISKTDTIKFWEELEEQLKSLLSPVGKLAVNRTVGNIMVSDHKYNVNNVATYLQHLKRTLHLQVDLEAQIFEVVFNDEFHFGIDWQNVMASAEKWAISSGGAAVGIPSSRLIVDNPIGGLTPAAPALSLAITKGQTKVVIDALKEQGHLEVVSQPRIRTLNNQSALVKVGTDKPFFRRTSIVTAGTGPVQTTSDVQVQTITIGTVLSVTPQISEDGWITMDISPVITRLVDSVEGPEQSTAPEVDIKQTSSLVRVREGTTVVIGGLIQNERYKTTRKIPVLGDIPILGYAFRGVFESKRRTELVIFITPTIVR